MLGEGFEDRLLNTLGIYNLIKAEPFNINGIICSPDMVSPDRKIYEIKLRVGKFKNGDPEEDYEYYLNQLKGYLAMSGYEEGILIICAIEGKDNGSWKLVPDIKTYSVTLEDGEAELIKSNLILTQELLKKGIENSEYEHLYKCPDWMCYTKESIMVKKPFCLDCDKEFSSNGGIKRHLNGKKGMGHSVIMAEYETTYQPRCSFYNECQPNI